MMTSEIMQMNKENAIIMVEACSPVWCTKITYYQEVVFKKSVFPPAERPSIDIRGFLLQLGVHTTKLEIGVVRKDSNNVITDEFMRQVLDDVS